MKRSPDERYTQTEHMEEEENNPHKVKAEMRLEVILERSLG
jgi:hypothetical protein